MYSCLPPWHQTDSTLFILVPQDRKTKQALQIFVESQSLHQYGGFGNYSFIYVAQTDIGRSINQEGGPTSCSLSEQRSGSDCASQDNSGTDQLISRTW